MKQNNRRMEWVVEGDNNVMAHVLPERAGTVVEMNLWRVTHGEINR
jgi:hypothetical protein